MNGGGDSEEATALAAQPVRRRVPWGAVATAAVVAGLAALWFLTPLRSYASVDALAAAGAHLRDSPVAPLWVVAVFVIGSLVFVPITPLLAATALIFDLTAGLVYGLVASTVAAWATYLMGKGVRRWRPQWLQTPRVQAWCVRLRRSAFMTIFLSRILPVGSFTLFNVAAGAVEIPMSPYLLGNALGLLPRMIAFAAVAEGMGRTAREPQATNWLLMAIATVGAVAVVALAWLRRRAARVTSARVR